MAKLTVKSAAKLVTNQDVGKHADGGGLYLVIRASGKPKWMFRFTMHGKRKELTLGAYDDVSLADARILAAEAKKSSKEGTNPIAERQRIMQAKIQTVDELFEDWHRDLVKRLKHPNIPERLYRKEIKPYIGQQSLSKVVPLDIRAIIEKVAQSGRPAISNDVLMYAKQLFNHGIKLGLLEQNPAAAFNVSDAGGVEKARSRVLSMTEIAKALRIFRDNHQSFTRDNYLAVALLLVLGVRKNELLTAQWSEFDLDAGLWKMPDTNKTGVAITVPLPTQAVDWLRELEIRACGSDYVFPSRRQAKRPHMGPDTLNTAIYKMFGREKRRGHLPTPNLMEDMEPFTVHDLRRTCRSLLASNGVPVHVAERCMNHKLKGVEGIYDRYDYLNERATALQGLADMLGPIINGDDNVVPLHRKVR